MSLTITLVTFGHRCFPVICGSSATRRNDGVAQAVAVKPPGGARTWTVVDESYQTVSSVEEWLEAHRHLWSPNTVRGYATSLAQWWNFLEQRGEAARWQEAGVPAVTAFLSWLRNGRTAEHALVRPGPVPSAETLEMRLAALISFYRWQEAVHSVPVAGRLMRGTPRRRPARGLLAHLDARSGAGPASLVRVRGGRRDRPPLLLPREIQAILDGCAIFDDAAGEWAGNLRDRMLFSLLAESGMRLGEALGLRVSDFVMGRGGTAHIEIVPRPGNPNGARVKMMRPRRVYVGSGLERLFADYLAHLACRAGGLGIAVTADWPLLVNLERPPLLAALGEGTVRDKVTSLRGKGIGPPGWTPHWFRHSHASALLLAGTPDWVVSRRLGHAHVQTTLDLYGWVREDEALRAAANWGSYAAAWQVSNDR
jgi:integrase